MSSAIRIVACAAACLPLVLAACGGVAPPPPPPQGSGPTIGERRMYQAGYNDGRQREVGTVQLALRTKDAEIDALRLRLARLERDAATAKASDSTMLQSCEVELQHAREQLALAESRPIAPTTPAESNARRSGSDNYEAPSTTPCCGNSRIFRSNSVTGVPGAPATADRGAPMRLPPGLTRRRSRWSLVAMQIKGCQLCDAPDAAFATAQNADQHEITCEACGTYTVTVAGARHANRSTSAYLGPPNQPRPASRGASRSRSPFAPCSKRCARKQAAPGG